MKCSNGKKRRLCYFVIVVEDLVDKNMPAVGAFDRAAETLGLKFQRG